MKKIIKKLIPEKLKMKKRLISKYIYLNYPNITRIKKAKIFAFKMFSFKVIDGEFADSKILKKSKIKLNINDFFASSLDEKILNGNKHIIGNITIDYEKVLEKSIFNLKKDYRLQDTKYDKREYALVCEIERYINKIKKHLDNKMIIDNLDQIIISDKLNIIQALQKILIINTVAWQIGIPLNGLGRLDYILDSYELPENIDDIIYNFLNILNSNYKFKSGALVGDTGQIIILGGLKKDGTYFSNKLTYVFIEQLKKLNKPDPKILLRVSSKMNIDLLYKAVSCIQTGIGSPLLSNDDTIIPILHKYCFNNDEYNYVTAACWEPMIVGKTMDQNNICGLNYLEPLQRLLMNEKIDLENLYEKYVTELKKYISERVKIVNSYEFSYNPLLSMYTENCNIKKLDVAGGGAIYNNFGFTTAGLSNLTNAFFNIKKYCKEGKVISLDELNYERLNNFNDDKILKLLKSNNKQYGLNDVEVVDFVNEVIQITQTELLKYKNKFNGFFKFGLSSPDYINFSKNLAASFDGRKNGDPLNVHISSNYSFDETISFACKLDYSKNSYNGNVIDFMITPDYIENNFDKFTNYIFDCIKDGFFQMQMNVVDSKKLIAAKKDPTLYPNLIVRVWGFSAYFNDLPDEYKDLMIERALKNEQR